MSNEWGILYHIGGRLRKDKGWSEKESDNPPDKFWEGEIENKLPNGFRTYTHRNGSQTMLDNTKMVSEKVRELGLYTMGVNLLVFGKIIEDGKESHLMKKVRKSENM